MREALLCWPAAGKPQAFVTFSGRSFSAANLAEDDVGVDAADDAIAAVIEWGCRAERGPLPDGWRMALAGDLPEVVQ